MENFPATSRMTDFEIVELGNQYLIDKKRGLQAAQVRATEAIIQDPIQILLPLPLADQHLPYTTPSPDQEQPQQPPLQPKKSSPVRHYSHGPPPTTRKLSLGLPTLMPTISTVKPKRIITTHMTSILYLNDLNPDPVISSVSPLTGSSNDHTYFLCRLCTYKFRSNSPKKVGAYPVIMNIGAIVQHLDDNHTRKLFQIKRRMSDSAEIYLGLIKQDLANPDHWIKTIPKASSTSCLEVLWKTNQQDQIDVENHCFEESYCLSHTKPRLTSGLPYTLDLANTVYCICQVNPKLTASANDISTPSLMPDPEISMGPTPTFIGMAKKAFIKTHRTLLRSPIIKSSPPAPIPEYSTRRRTRNMGEPAGVWTTAFNFIPFLNK